MRIGAQGRLMRVNLVAADPAHIVERRAKTDGLDDRRRPRLETMRRIVVGDEIAGDLLDHLAAAEEGRHSVEPFLLAIERADARRPIKLVAGNGVEIDIE